MGTPDPALLLLFHLAQQTLDPPSARHSAKREELCRIVTENAADMIALVNVKGRLCNVTAYQKVLGCTAAELARTNVFEQIHPDDRAKVLESCRQAPRNRSRQEPPGPFARQRRLLGCPRMPPAPSATRRDKLKNW